MNYVGFDFHKNYSFITEVDETGVIGRQIKPSNDYNTLKEYLKTLSPSTKIAIEATCNWYYFKNWLKTMILMSCLPIH